MLDPQHDRRFDLVKRLFGAGTSGPLFGGSPKVPTPWPSAGRLKKGSPYDLDLIHESLRGGPNMEEIDPRWLHASQPWILQEHVNYYMGGDYAQTGRTARDQAVNSNQVPRLYVRPDQRVDILSGHHRAAASLLHGVQFKAHIIREE
jgi:hypothetical protein